MCGVAAIFAYHDAAPQVDRDELRRIRDHMVSRGPDGKGEWFSDDGRVGLGHRRLSIIDLSDRGAQPMSNQDGSVIVSFNGEIYNYKQLREELEHKGYIYGSKSDDKQKSEEASMDRYIATKRSIDLKAGTLGG